MLRLRLCRLLLLLLAFVSAVTSPIAQATPYDLVIRNGRVLDGLGNPWIAADVAIKGQIIELMIDLQKEFDVSYLFISHDMAAVERICDRVAVMYFGEIVEIGPRDDVIGRPGHPYTQRLLSAIPITHPNMRASRPRRIADASPPLSPIKPVGYTAPAARWGRAAAGHFIRQTA